MKRVYWKSLIVTESTGRIAKVVEISAKKKSKREVSKYKRNTTSTKENVPSKIEVQARENTIKAGKKCRTETQCVDYARLYGSSVSKIAVFA